MLHQLKTVDTASAVFSWPEQQLSNRGRIPINNRPQTAAEAAAVFESRDPYKHIHDQAN